MPSKTISAPLGPAVRPNKPAFKPLTLPSLDFSLTAGTNIPSPPATPTEKKQSDGTHERRPSIPLGGPLSSHPTSPINDMPGAFPATPTSTELKANKVLGREPGAGNASLAGAAPSGAASAAGTTSRRNSLGGRRLSIRRLFSFRSLYGDNAGTDNSATDCFAPGAGGSTTHLSYDPTKPNRLARMTSNDSFAQPYRLASSMANARPDSRMTDASSTALGLGGGSPALRRKRSSGWFGSGARRKSALFMVGRVDEDGMIREEGATGAGAEREPPPTIKEVHVDTSIGGEELFKDIK